MNGSLIFVLLIVTIVMCANIVQTWLKQRRPVPEENNELEATLAKIEVLEERVRVLERIVTENRFDLKEEIDSL